MLVVNLGLDGIFVDVRTQAMYQMMDEGFIGLIFSVFNEDKSTKVSVHDSKKCQIMNIIIVIIITLNEKTFSLNYTHMKPSGKMIYMVNSE